MRTEKPAIGWGRPRLGERSWRDPPFRTATRGDPDVDGIGSDPKGAASVRNYDNSWTEDQTGLYDECYTAGHAWAADPDTPTGELQAVLTLAELDDEFLTGEEIDYPPALVDAVTDAIGESVNTVPATREHPGFRGFVDGARDGAVGEEFGL